MNNIDHQIELIGTVIFFIAVVHTFFVKKIAIYSHKYPKQSWQHGLLHLLSELEIVFGVWAGLFLILFSILRGAHSAIEYQNSLQFTEPLFIFVIMTICSTRPILAAARSSLMVLSQILQKVLKLTDISADLLVILFVGPLTGSFITEPAAMTVNALMLNSMIKDRNLNVLYLMVATLFVNVSIGGTLTTFAAPPVLMVANKWGWDSSFIITHIGWHSIIAALINTILFLILLRKQIPNTFFTLKEVSTRLAAGQSAMPFGVIFIHLVFLVFVVLNAHSPNVFLGLFLLFLGVTTITQRHQDSLRMRDALLVAFFLGGIIVFGAFQKWWLTPILQSLGELPLFISATVLTAFTDNAALTYLGSQVEGLSEASKIALVAGAVCGGGLTVIANAPNPAGYSILSKQFEDGVINPIKLFKFALLPTVVAFLCLWFL